VAVTDLQFERLQERVRELEATLAAIVKPDGTIVLSSQQKITISVGPCRIVLDENSLTIASPVGIKLEANSVELSGAMVRLNSGAPIVLTAPVVSATGIVRCDTIMATNVIGANYTPGAGNIR
jgi:hypothetical protein